MKRLAEKLYLELPHSLNSLEKYRIENISQVGVKEYCLVDLRPEEEYNHRHLPEAVNIPFPQFENRMEELPGEVTVLAYCRDKYCDLADRAVQLLEGKGKKGLAA